MGFWRALGALSAGSANATDIYTSSEHTNSDYGADQTVYLIVDSFDSRGSSRREIEIERADLETIVVDLISGQFNDPIRIVAFYTLEQWAYDISEEVADEILDRCDIEGIAALARPFQ